MNVSFGPCGHHPMPAAKHRGSDIITTDLATFYDESRKNRFSGTYSLLSVVAPVCIFVAAIAIGNEMLSNARLQKKESVPELPIEAFCRTAQQHVPLQLGVLADTIHFTAAHVALLGVCALAYGAGATSIRNVLTTHYVLSSERTCLWISLIAPVILGVMVFGGTAFLLEPRISHIADKLFPVTVPPSACEVLSAVKNLKHLMDQQIRIGSLCVSIGVTALLLAASTTAFRFERSDMNGMWSKGFVLRHKLNSLLTLLFIGSILLVISNIALTSALDWLTGILDVVKDATEGTDKNSSPDQTTRAVVAAFAAIDTLRGSLANFISVISALVLVGIFAPAVYGLTNEITIAGKCHGQTDAPQKGKAATRLGAQGILVAGWESVCAWKVRHGLNLSFGDLTGSFLAVLGPLLSSRLIDLTKLATGGGS